MGCCITKSPKELFTDLPVIKTVEISPRLQKNMEYLVKHLEEVKNYEPEKFKPYTICGLVVKVYDGDTVTVNAVVDQNIHQYKIRLAGIDTPEIRTKNLEEKELATQIRNVLAEKILNKPAIVTVLGNDKYNGRHIGKINSKEIGDVSLWLLNNKYAVEYDGKKKPEFNSANYIKPESKAEPVSQILPGGALASTSV